MESRPSITRVLLPLTNPASLARLLGIPSATLCACCYDDKPDNVAQAAWLHFCALYSERFLVLAAMLTRKLRFPPSLLLLIGFLFFFGWQLSQGTRHEDGPVGSQVIPGEDKQAPRIAVMTFVTDQRSYLHLSLKNKDRKECDAIEQ